MLSSHWKGQPFPERAAATLHQPTRVHGLRSSYILIVLWVNGDFDTGQQRSVERVSLAYLVYYNCLTTAETALQPP